MAGECGAGHRAARPGERSIVLSWPLAVNYLVCLSSWQRVTRASFGALLLHKLSSTLIRFGTPISKSSYFTMTDENDVGTVCGPLVWIRAMVRKYRINLSGRFPCWRYRCYQFSRAGPLTHHSWLRRRMWPHSIRSRQPPLPHKPRQRNYYFGLQ